MTTSSANNSVFKGFFKKQKLTEPNFIDWYQQLRIVLSIADKLNYLEQPIPPALVLPAGQHVAPEILVAHNAWIKGSKEIVGLMLMTMNPEIQQNLETLHAHEMILELKTLFAQQAEQKRFQTTRYFHFCKQEEGQFVSSYVLKMKGYIDNLERLGHPVTFGPSGTKSWEEEKNKQAYAPKPKIPPPPKREDPSKDSICHECGETGHWKRNCPQYLAKLLKKKKNAASRAGGSGIFVIELNNILNRSWIYDTGCGTHICNTTQGLRASRKLKPGALSLYVGNGQREAVEAIGVFYLCLPSGLDIVLNNCHYAPSITRGVISVSRLYEDGFINRFVNNTIQVFRNNMVYFSAIPRDGIFEIDLSNSYTNESSIYVVSNKRAKLELDSALLWHCRLEHISKKRIENRYGYVYLLKHKHEVFDTFKVFQKEVENQLGLSPYRTPPYTPKHNGVSERRNRTLLDMIRSMMSQTTLPKSFWDYALETATRILNIIPTKKVEKAPYENKVLVARNAEFLENSLINQEASGSLEDLEIIQEEDTHPSIDTSLNHEENVLEIDEPQSDIVPIRRSTRTRHAPDCICLYIDAEERELGDLGEPANYKAALLDPESEKWLNAMNVEMQSMKDNEVWVLVELPPNGKTVGSKWLFKKKTDMDGVVHTYKARLVAKGYTQTQGIDYKETLSPVADIRAIRILIAITAYYDYEIWQMDVKTAFFNRYLNEEVYMEQPEGFVNPKYPNRTGYVFVLNGGDVDWKSAKQIIFATSSAEAEYIAAFDASKEAVWVRKFISRLGVVPTIEEPISMYCDNTISIDIANESGITKGARHLRAKVHYLRKVIEYGDVKLEKVHTDDNLANPFTKALAFLKHSEHTRNIGMLPASSLM
uniref:Retrotransposon protein, putative, Ty1-copia subclass n=1 Tax=Tanacetum cinerariifolium TaxID=118510 RepID=A0A6L2L2H6_TANCI|nr:hypothetical protein [Tanacetum cinerariifolium]